VNNGIREILQELYLPKHMMEMVLHSNCILEVGMVLQVYPNHEDNNFHVFLVMAEGNFQVLLVLFIHMDLLEPMTILGCSCIPFLDMGQL
jgi:hypothetical protein